jgi:hypothetical protein
MATIEAFLKNRKEIEYVYVNRRLDELLLREEIMWRQRSRVSWLKHGDQNTKFFHRKASWRAKKNRIWKLKKVDGRIVDKQGDIEIEANQYFKEMYTKEKLVVPELIEELIEQKVDTEMNEKLTKEFSDEEISDALFQIGPLKAPGVDGFPARFFQRNWGMLKKEITAAVKINFSDGIMPEEINETVLVVIQKINDPQTLKDYIPTALCNVIYKVVVKCIINRMRPMLDSLISDS